MLKSIHLTNAWHETSGGIATFYRALLSAAEMRRHQMRLIVPGERNVIEPVGQYGLIYHLRAHRAPLNPEYRMMYPTRFLRSDGAIVRILQQERPDVVEICDKYTLNYLGGMLRERMIRQLDFRPTIIGLSCERMDQNLAVYLSQNDLGRRFARFYMKWIYFPFFDHHIANSAHTAGELAEAGRGHKVRRGVWLGPMGVDLEAFSPSRRHGRKRLQIMKRFNQPPSSVLLLYAGRLAREKNLLLLIQTMEHLVQHGTPDFHLLVAGSGDMRASIEATATKRIPQRVSFLGHLTDREELADLYANCDVFVHPNPAEPFGIAPLEAMAAGLPLVAPDSGGLTAYANASNAWLTGPTPEQFAHTIQSLLADHELRERRRTAAIATASQFSWKMAADRFLDLYQDLHELTQGHRSAPVLEPIFYSTEGDHWGREIQRPSAWPTAESAGTYQD